VIAWDADEVAGGCINLIDHAENAEQGYLRGWLDSVFVRRRWRQRGLAKALVGRSLERLRERGMTSAQLGVDVDNTNRALDLYRNAGFEVRSSETAWRRPWPAAAGVDRAE
jgi:ribosomal protein S18 acetylase RimI-like enzyme